MVRLDPALEIVDAQIHEPGPTRPLGAQYPPEVATLVNVEMAREAMDAVGVDAALAVADKAFIAAAIDLYPDRFAGVITFDWAADDLEQQVAEARRTKGVVAGRALVGNWKDATLRPEFGEGKFHRIFRAAEKEGLPLFCSTHGWAGVMDVVAEEFPDLPLIIDHVGVSQHPVSPPNDDPWGRLPGLLKLARYRNVAVKVCGVPLLSAEGYPYRDVWPFMRQIIDAFGAERLMWASDYTRMKMADLPKGPRPRRRGLLYSDCLTWLSDSDQVSLDDKRQILGGTVRRLLNWSRPS